MLIGAKIEELDESTGGGYQFLFVVEQQHKYQVYVSIKVKDFSREIGADFNLTYKLLGTNDDFRVIKFNHIISILDNICSFCLFYKT